MSKSRNRNVNSFPASDLLNFLLPTHHQKSTKRKLKHEEEYFGENIFLESANNSANYSYFGPRTRTISKESPPSSSVLSNSDNYLESLILGVNKANRDISSSSSLSWSDEFESEASKKVQEELERLDRILRGLEPIPQNYDKEEIEEWMETFPNLSILDYPKVNNEATEFQNQIQNSCDNPIFEKVSNRLLTHRISTNHKSYNLNPIQNKNIALAPTQPIIKFDNSYLKISPIKCNERQQSSKSLWENQFSHGSKENSPEYTSLPILLLPEGPTERNTFSTRSQNRRKTKNNVSGRKINNNLILPPIDSNNHFRSISVTPRNGNGKTSLSAFVSLKRETKNNRKNELTGLFVDNSLQKNENKYIFQ